MFIYKNLVWRPLLKICGKMQNCDLLLIRKNDAYPGTRKRRGSMRAHRPTWQSGPCEWTWSPACPPAVRCARRWSHFATYRQHLPPCKKNSLRVFGGYTIQPFYLHCVAKKVFRIRDVVERIRIPDPYHWTTDPDCRWGPGRFPVGRVGYVLV